MNSIIEHQNDQHILDKLSAQRNIYSEAKCWRNIRFIVCVLSVIVLSVMKAIWSDNKTITIVLLVTVFISLLLGPVFNLQIAKKKVLAARIQQLIDIYLFDLVWDDHLCGQQPTAEVILDHRDNPIPSDLYNWYDKGIGDIQDFKTAVLLCQRENLFYDSHIRTTYTNMCKRLAAILCMGIFITGVIIYHADIIPIIVFGLIPITPIIRWIQSVVNEDEKDKSAREMLESLVYKEMENAINGKPIHSTELKRIQGYMFIHRRDGYLVPDWYYKFSRSKSEARVAYSVQEYLERFKPIQKGLD